MKSVLVLISDTSARAVTQELADRVARALPSAGPQRWLNRDLACEMTFTAPDEDGTQDLSNRLSDVLAGATVDFAIVPVEGRKKSLLLADMDSTIIGQECIDELADMAGVGPHVADITARAMRGELAFADALRERVGLLKDLDSALIESVIAERLTFNPGAETLVKTMRANGAYTALVSGGFTDFTAHVADAVGFDEHRGNRLEIESGRLSGTVAEPILGRDAKVQALVDIAAAHGITPEDAIAVGDGANDLDMLARAGFGVAIHAKPIVADAAQFRIDHGDLTALLYLQGYSADEFVS